MKSRNFGKKAPQNFDSERATIADRQGGSENQNFEVIPNAANKFIFKRVKASKIEDRKCLCIPNNKALAIEEIRRFDALKKSTFEVVWV